ncbi:MAG: hypothetical protein KA399_04030 [Chitinophagaceae bacterium]|nr:hypothetical protein [Chitinophagaceae bacterium]
MKVILMFLFLFPFFVFAQNNTFFSIGLEGGVTPKAKTIFDSSYVNLPHKRNQVVALNLFWEKAIDSAKRFELGVGLRNAVYFVQDGWSNTDMDPANNGFPRNGKDFATLRNGFGALFDLKTSLSVLFRYCFLQDSKYRFYIGILPDISVYWPNPEGSRLFQVFNQTGVLYTVYEGYTDFYKGKDDGHNSYDIKIENTFTLGCKLKASKRTILGIDLNYHIGTKKLERTDLTFYPDLPQFTAKVHYSQNNNYLSLGIRYFFNKKGKRIFDH